MAPSPGACSTGCSRSRGSAIDGISGTSAGAMNAAVHGRRPRRRRRRGRARGARRPSGAASPTPPRFSPLQRSPLDMLLGRWTLDYSPAYVAIDLMSRLFSPYDLDSGGPIRWRDMLAESIDFSASPRRRSSSSSPRPTCAPDAAARVPQCRAVTPDVLLASACLPTMFQAVEIDGEAYWDGGYSGNPTMTPLVSECVVGRHDSGRRSTRSSGRACRAAREILNRLNEVSFNAVLLKELRMMALLRQVATPATARARTGPRMRIHLHRERHAWPSSAPRPSSTPNGPSSTMLRDEGRRAARGVPRRARRGPRPALDARHRRAAGRRLSHGPARHPARPRRSWSGSPTAAGACCCWRRPPHSSRPHSPASRCWRTGRRPSWAARRSSSRSSSRCSCSARCSAS